MAQWPQQDFVAKLSEMTGFRWQGGVTSYSRFIPIYLNLMTKPNETHGGKTMEDLIALRTEVIQKFAKVRYGF